MLGDSKYVTEVNWDVGGHMSAGREGHTISMIVMHHNAATRDIVPQVWQGTNGRAASAHYQVTPTAVRQMVREADTAWHAGNWDTNLISIGIEHLNNTGSPNWTVAPETEERSAWLVADIAKRYNIPLDRDHYKKHSEVKTNGTTTCPGGLRFDWILERAKQIKAQWDKEEAEEAAWQEYLKSTNPTRTFIEISTRDTWVK